MRIKIILGFKKIIVNIANDTMAIKFITQQKKFMSLQIDKYWRDYLVKNNFEVVNQERR